MMKWAPGKNRQSFIGSPCSDLESKQPALFMKDRRENDESCGSAEDQGALAGCGETFVSDLGIDNQHVRDYE
jgi:hypothetical protein